MRCESKNTFQLKFLFSKVIYSKDSGLTNFLFGITRFWQAMTNIVSDFNLSMNVFALRLTPGQDLKKTLDAFTIETNLQAGFIVTCVGSLRKVVIRPADSKEPLFREQKFEIVSLTGTLSPDGSHLHIALSDSAGVTIGGHLLEGNLIYTTAEIIVGEAEGVLFRREQDAETGYKELTIKRIQ